MQYKAAQHFVCNAAALQLVITYCSTTDITSLRRSTFCRIQARGHCAADEKFICMLPFTSDFGCWSIKLAPNRARWWNRRATNTGENASIGGNSASDFVFDCHRNIISVKWRGDMRIASTAHNWDELPTLPQWTLCVCCVTVLRERAPYLWKASAWNVKHTRAEHLSE